MKKIWVLLFCIWGLCGCAGGTPAVDAPSYVSTSSTPSISQDTEKTDVPAPLPDAESYIDTLAGEILAQVTTSSMDEVSKIQAIYCYMVEKIYFADPPVPDLWRYRCDPDTVPSYLYNRALGPLAYRVGSCEDYAAALTVLLRRAGFSAEYVSGLTVSANRKMVDHAWTVVKYGDYWYHLDSQLEQNVLKDGQLTFRYFLRDDSWMAADHLWGRALASYWSGRQTPAQQTTLLETMTPPACTDRTLPRPQTVSCVPEPPDIPAVLKELDAEKHKYLENHGPLSPITLNWEPPIFRVMPPEDIPK